MPSTANSAGVRRSGAASGSAGAAEARHAATTSSQSPSPVNPEPSGILSASLPSSTTVFTPSPASASTAAGRYSTSRRSHHHMTTSESTSTSNTATESSLRARNVKQSTISAASGQGAKRGKSTAVAGAASTGTVTSTLDGQSAGDQEGEGEESVSDHGGMPTLSPAQAPHPRWVLFALLSGGFAALNGVFAKLTTSSDTPPFTSFLTSILPTVDPTVIQVILRSAFFGLNLASNAIMWVLFTRALTSHPSTTKVSVVNTSANFALTAVLGALVFREAVGGPGGIVGLALLVGGCVVLGAKKDGGSETDNGTTGDGDGGGIGALAADGPLVDAEAGRALAGETGEEPYRDEVPYRDDLRAQVADGEATQSDLISLSSDVAGPKQPRSILDGTESDEET